MNQAMAILLPGNMCDARLWSGGGELLRTMLDRRSISWTNADLTRDDSISAMATRALAAVDGPVLPIGFSMGAIVAVEMAMLAPQRVAGLVLAGYNATADLPERAAIRPQQQAEVRAGGLERVLVEELKPNYLADPNRRDANLLALLRDMGLELGDEVFIRLTYVSADDRITLQAYVENLEDHAVLNRTAIGANRSINASYALPRTYGVKAGYKF